MIDFPTAVPGQTFQAAGLVWQYDGIKWAAATVADEPGNIAEPVTIVVTVSTVLPAGFTGTVLVEAIEPLILTLPPDPVLGQEIRIKDVSGYAAAYNITVNTMGASLIDDTLTYTIIYGFGNLGIVWSGARWSVM